MPGSTMTSDRIREERIRDAGRRARLALRHLAGSVTHAADELRRAAGPYLKADAPQGDLAVAVEALERIADSPGSPDAQREARLALWKMGLLDGAPDPIPSRRRV